MSTYRAIVGKKIKSLSSDPTEGADGQMWYNTTTQSLRGLAISEAWSSASNLVTGVMGGITFGTQTAGNYVAGFSPSVPATNANQEYNGTGWNTDTNFPSSQTGSGGGAGPQTAGLAAGGGGGSRVADAFEYDGSSWTSTGSLPSAADNIGSCGTETQSNVIMAMGRIPTSGNSGNNTTAVYNGSTFSSGPNVGTARMFGPGGGAGTGTAGLVFGGFIDPSPNAMTNTEEYDGSSWTAGGSLSNPSGLNCGWGTQTNAIAQCNPSTYKTFEGYDGTSWSSKPSTATNGNGYANAAGATGSAGWITSLGPTYKTTEEFNESVNVVTGATWSSGGNLNTARDEGASSQNGLQTAALYFGGYSSDPASNATEQYDGSTWTTKNNLNTARYSGAGAGTTAAALYSGGFSNPSTLQSAVEEWDGTNWTTQPNSLSTARVNSGGCGLQTSALVFGGVAPSPGSPFDNTEEYDGSAWTNGGAMPSGQSHFAGYFGTQTAALAAGGNNPGSTYITTSVEYGGESWTAGGALITGTRVGAGAGIQSDGIVFGGATAPGAPNYTGLTQGYDGTAFSTRPSMATARIYPSGTGTTAAGLAFGGNEPPYGTATEEFTGETSVANVETFQTT